MSWILQNQPNRYTPCERKGLNKRLPDRKKPSSPEVDLLSRPQLLSVIAATALILLLVAKVWLHFDPVQLPFMLSWKAIGIGAGLGFSISVVSVAAYWLWPAYRRSTDFYLNFVLAPLVLADSIWIGLLPGMSEELLFRGVMLPSIGLNGTGLLVSSFCFGMLHMSSKDQWPYAVWASLIGLILGSSVLITGNLLVPVTAHILTNFVSSLFWQLKRESSSAST